MDALIKVLVLILSLFLIFFPLLPIRTKRKKFNTITTFKYEKPHFRANAVFILLSVAEIIVFAFLATAIADLGKLIADIPFVGSFLSDVMSRVDPSIGYIAFAITVLLSNLIIVYAYALLKALLKKVCDRFVYTDEEKRERIERKNAKRAAKSKKQAADDDLFMSDRKKSDKKSRKKDNIPDLKHLRNDRTDDDSSDETDNKESNVTDETDTDNEKESKKKREPSFITKLFFESPEYLYAKLWVRRMENILQYFVYITEAFFVLFFAALFLSALFPVSDGLYNFFLNTLNVQKWYYYPFLSLILLQEICNTFHTGIRPTEENGEVKTEEKLIAENKVILRGLASELKRYFDKDHKLRFYPGLDIKPNEFEYKFTNSQYNAALEYIRHKLANKNGSGQSYLECMDALYNDEHVYFCGSFYSQIGEYIIAYTYTRLLSGARLIFIVSDESKRDAVRRYIQSRLVKMTGGSAEATWRVYTSDDRLDQADIFVASPSDFKDSNIVESFPDFFEEVCNAVFIDADKIVSLESYLCPVMAIRLHKATDNRVRFMFLSTNLLRGFAASSLPKLFCVDKILSFSSASDNESVEYTLWNRESLKNRIYYKYGQKLLSLEGIIAEKAYKYGVDGIRLITNSAIDHGEREILAGHGVEINEFFKDVPKINYMIYTDERCNLAAAIYACTRFKGQRNSVSQIISKPYLLRDYFMAKAAKENFIKRSSYIQPRITEHAKREKLSLLKIFCRASVNGGISVTDFINEMREVINLSHIRGDVPLCKYCADPRFYDDSRTLNEHEYAAYLIAALCDDVDTDVKNSHANSAKDYYLVFDSINRDAESSTKDKCIEFEKVRDVLKKVFSCNDRVILRLNDSTIGSLDTFSTRLPLEYVPGQPIVYNNVEYEIEQISADNKIVFLRRENVAYKNCLDTLFLRRYKIYYTEKIGQDGVVNNFGSMLNEIRVSMQKVGLDGETYGFYNLMSNNQSLNFKRGVEGNPHFEQELIDRNRRVFCDGRMLRVTLQTGMECTDGMRMLLSSVFNEFIKTMFPMAYRCIAILPVLQNDIVADEPRCDTADEVAVEKIKRLYPYQIYIGDRFFDTADAIYKYVLPENVEADDSQTDNAETAEQFIEFLDEHSDCREALEKFYPELTQNDEELDIRINKLCPNISSVNRKFIQLVVAYYDKITETKNNFRESDPNRMQFIFLNDCSEDVGVLDWFYDKLATNMQELLINAYSYLYWLNVRRDLDHYIYFGMDSLPNCYDLDGLCKLLADYNIIISDNGEKNYETASDSEDEETRRCAFCHKLMETGRYSYFDDDHTLFICADCMDLIGKQDRLLELEEEVKKYLETTYPEIEFRYCETAFAEEKENIQDLGEWYFRIDPDSRKIVVGFDLPERNAKIAILLGMISFWQYDNDLMTEYSGAQLSYEEIKYLQKCGDGDIAQWLLENMSDERRYSYEVLEEKISLHSDNSKYTSFSAMRELGSELYDDEDEDYEDIEGEDYSDDLYDPRKVPRFWKRYLRNGLLDERVESNDDTDEQNLSDDDDTDDTGDADDTDDIDDTDGENEDMDLTEDEESDSDESDDAEDEEYADNMSKPNCRIFYPPKPNCPPPGSDIDDDLNEQEDEEDIDLDEDISDLDGEPDEDVDDGSDEDVADEPEEESEDETNETENEIDEESDDYADEEDEEDLDDETEDDSEDKDDDDGSDEDDITDTDEDDDDIDDLDDEDEDDIDKNKKRKQSGGDNDRTLRKIRTKNWGLKILPYEKDEKENPSIRIYNEIVRHAYNFDSGSFSCEGVDNKRLYEIFRCVLGDYPEIFWVNNCWSDGRNANLSFRCKKPSGELDIQQILKKLNEIKHGARKFTRGISRRTDPYKALIKLYKRLILALDYDGIGLDAKIDQDITKDDRLRSLHSALVRKKCVCAGYATAMQYLCQLIGLPCAYVISEVNGEETHAFNIVKIGKYCYYIDATWGDASNTQNGDKDKDLVRFEYCCVPYEEFIKTSSDYVKFHIPSSKYYPWFKKELKANRHEYYRYRKSYLTRYNEEDLARIFAYCAEHYDPKEDGRYYVSFRCSSQQLAHDIQSKLRNPETYKRIVSNAQKLVKRKARANKLLQLRVKNVLVDYTPIVRIVYESSK